MISFLSLATLVAAGREIFIDWPDGIGKTEVLEDLQGPIKNYDEDTFRANIDSLKEIWKKNISYSIFCVFN